MRETLHTIHYTDSRDLSFISDKSIDLVVTSPPYPMIRMWDDLFISLNPEIGAALEKNDGRTAFEIMHRELDKIWGELYRVLKNGRIACINIGDATRTVGETFRLYSNHSRITECCVTIGFDTLPLILWRKTTNAPNKFMGSGMYPGGAYVTLEHEYIIILRKKEKRSFAGQSKSLPAKQVAFSESKECKRQSLQIKKKSVEMDHLQRKWFPFDNEKENRRQSAYFWEERNTWFSDTWDIKGDRQDMDYKDLRTRSAAFPFELAYRLIHMYSVYGDTILDPFLGTGTTMHASMALCRNSVGLEIDRNFHNLIQDRLPYITEEINLYTSYRLKKHRDFVSGYTKGKLKYTNKYFTFPVMTKQEEDLILYYLDKYEPSGENSYKMFHIPFPRDQICEISPVKKKGEDQLLLDF